VRIFFRESWVLELTASRKHVRETADGQVIEKFVLVEKRQ